MPKATNQIAIFNFLKQTRNVILLVAVGKTCNVFEPVIINEAYYSPQHHYTMLHIIMSPKNSVITSCLYNQLISYLFYTVNVLPNFLHTTSELQVSEEKMISSWSTAMQNVLHGRYFMTLIPKGHRHGTSLYQPQRRRRT